MKYRIEPRAGYVHAEILERQTARDMREFLVVVHAACREHECPRVLLAIRKSRVIFKAEDYGLSTAGAASGYVAELVKPDCQIALVADNPELHAAHEYIELVARQQKINVRAFSDEPAAVRWLQASTALAGQPSTQPS
jgi:hypothetical protein